MGTFGCKSGTAGERISDFEGRREANPRLEEQREEETIDGKSWREGSAQDRTGRGGGLERKEQTGRRNLYRGNVRIPRTDRRHQTMHAGRATNPEQDTHEENCI